MKAAGEHAVGIRNIAEYTKQKSNGNAKEMLWMGSAYCVSNESSERKGGGGSEKSHDSRKAADSE